MKAQHASKAQKLIHIPNIGKRVSEDLNIIGIKHPLELKNQNPFDIYNKLCKKVGFKIDPCMIDVFMSAVDFMNGAKPTPWWFYTPERKRILKTKTA